ncbi:unnamed protein product [Rotaria socialis]|uniref:TIR domain-containing protein n=3 Tax=Rotaria socialis TaxID=392032 RepID=A0A818TUE9_9BILA|nr:unnamed protein product [Rotaria socialis]CAF3688092.1 unnamed protein product [Rotaria socialis]CAF4391913.1 unnamed protein product [Rotaria socialis]
MQAVPKERRRTVQVVSLSEPASSSIKEPKLTKDIPGLFLNLRDILLQKTLNEDEINFNISRCAESIRIKFLELTTLAQPTEIFDVLQATLKIYVNQILSIDQCRYIFSNQSFKETFSSLLSIQQTLDLDSTFENNPDYARTVFYRSFDLLSSPSIIDFLNDKYPDEISPYVSIIFRAIIGYIWWIIQYIVFKKDDMQNQVPIVRLLLEYIDRKKQRWNETEIHDILTYILGFICTLANETILIPNMIEAKCSDYILKWISVEDLQLEFKRLSLHILHNIARHENGVDALNSSNCISILKEFQQRVIKPNQDNNDALFADIQLVYCMAFSLVSEPRENQEDLNSLRKILDQLMQAAVDCGQSANNKSNGFHVSEPIVVLTKLCVHDDILKYILTESSVENLKAKSRMQFFCELLFKFRGALASDNDLDQLSLTALFNIIWSISFHTEYIEELKANSKFLMTVKSLANDDGEDLVDQYVPKNMASISKAANGILWNLDENNPARAPRTTTVPSESKPLGKDTSMPDRMRVMVSYAHADSDFCHQLVDALQKDTRLQIWVDFEYCHTGDLWEEIALAIEESRVIIFLMSKDYQDSQSCRQEVMYTKDSQKKRFIPVYIKKDFVATGWLGVRIVGPQYIRFGKHSFDDTVKELIKLIIEDEIQQESNKNKQTDQSSKPSPPIDKKPVDNTDNQVKPTENNHANSAQTPLKKPIEQWKRKDIIQWFDDNHIHQELADLYDFQCGTDLLLYGQCLRPDWQIEYQAISERYELKYKKKLYRDQFVILVGAINRLQPSNSKLCNIS